MCHIQKLSVSYFLTTYYLPTVFKTYFLVSVFSLTGKILSDLKEIQDGSAFVTVGLSENFKSGPYEYTFKKFIHPKERIPTEEKFVELQLLKYRTAKHPQSPLDAQKVHASEKHFWFEQPSIIVKLQDPERTKKDNSDSKKKNVEKKSKKNSSKKPDVGYVYNYEKLAKIQPEKIDDKKCDKKFSHPIWTGGSSKYPKHNCIFEELKKRKLQIQKAKERKLARRSSRSPYKVAPIHNCVLRHWSQETIQVEVESDDKKKKKKKKEKKNVRVKCIKPGLKPLQKYNMPPTCNTVWKSVDDFLPAYLKKTYCPYKCTETSSQQCCKYTQVADKSVQLDKNRKKCLCF